MQRIFIKNVSYLWGKCSSRKAVPMWVKKRGKRFADDEEVEAEVRK
jgi:hypothetical protein